MRSTVAILTLAVLATAAGQQQRWEAQLDVLEPDALAASLGLAVVPVNANTTDPPMLWRLDIEAEAAIGVVEWLLATARWTVEHDGPIPPLAWRYPLPTTLLINNDNEPVLALKWHDGGVDALEALLIVNATWTTTLSSAATPSWLLLVVGAGTAEDVEWTALRAWTTERLDVVALPPSSAPNELWFEALNDTCALDGPLCVRSDDKGACACIPGTFLPQQAQVCVECASGTYKSSYGNADACTPCAGGWTTGGLPGQSVCLPCPLNQSSPSGDRPCAPCQARAMTSTVGNARCGCVPGAAFDVSGAVCVPCAPGLYQASPDWRGRCLACPHLSSSTNDLYGDNGGATACTFCMAGAFHDGEECMLCPPGWFTAVGGCTACSACAPGAFAAAAGASACLACAQAGLFQPDYAAHFCAPCPGGTAASPDGRRCDACPPGTYAAASMTSCGNCEAGAYASGAGMTACADCPALMTADASRARCTCAPGAAADWNNQRCNPCIAGLYAPAAGMRACALCPFPTTSAVAGATACAACAVGSFALANGVCVLCPEGTAYYGLQAVWGGACVDCAAGTYTAWPGQTACADCAAGTYASAAGSSVCAACPPFSSSSTSNHEACVCDSGWWLPLGGSACVPCPNGAVQQGCVPCPAGTYAGDIGEGMACLGCPVGTFAAVAGWTACVACPPYATTSPRGYATACFCEAGAVMDYADLGAGCEPCAPGWFQAAPGLRCAPCAPGTYQPALLGTACSACPNHTDAPVAGMSRCLDCSEQVTPDRTACQCFPGFFSNNGSACAPCLDECPPGEFLAAPCRPDADAACGACTAPEARCVVGATYVRQNCTLRRDVVCWPCLPGCVQGWYVAQPCTLYDDLRCRRCHNLFGCAPGEYVAQACGYDTDTLCLPCPAGSVSADGFTCVACADGTAAVAGDDECVECAAYADPDHAECVAACPRDAYPAGPKQCAWCPDGAVSPDGALCVLSAPQGYCPA